MLFSDNIIYSYNNISSFNSLAYFLISIYITELDFYVFSIIYHFSFMYSNLFLFPNTKKSLFKFIPLKFSLYIFNNVPFLVLLNSNCDQNFCKKKEIYITKNILKRFFFYVRYIDFLLFGFIASMTFILKIKLKLVKYLKGNLHLKLSKLIISYDNDVFINYLGHNFIVSNLFNEKNSQSRYFQFNKIFFHRLFFRKLKFFNSFIIRYYRQFNYTFLEFFNSYDFYRSTDSIIRKILFYTFYLNVYRNLISQDCIFLEKFFLNEQSFNLNFNSNFVHLSNYQFGLFLFSLRRILFKVIYNKVNLKNNLISYSDFFLKILALDFSKKNIFLFKSYFLFDFDFTILKRRLFLRQFTSQSYFFLKLFFFNNLKLISKGYLNFFMHNLIIVNFSRFNILYVFKFFGFINSINFYPISNVKYIFIEDIVLINFFNSFSNFLLRWFFYCSNYSQLFIFVKLLEKACFLTISRKHKKTKNWSFSIFSNIYTFFNKVSFSLTYLVRVFTKC